MNDTTPSLAEAQWLAADLNERARSLPARTPDQLAQSEADREAVSIRMIEEGRRRDARNRYLEACPTEFRTSDWSHPEIQPFRGQIDKVLNYQVGPKGILATGPTGRRKTGAMWALMERLTCQEGRDVLFYTAFDFFARLQEQVKYGHDDARGWVERIARRPLVYIDDYGQQSLLKTKEDWALGWFFRFLDIRAGEHLPLFITTNMTGDEIAGGQSLRADPLLRRFLMVADPVQFLTEAELAKRRRK